jgi:Protein of unknown function (DUF4232)
MMAVAGLVTACSSTSSSTPAPAGFGSPSAVPPTASGLASCQTRGLRITVDDGQADGAAGSTYYPLDFTNTSAATCALYGYPGVSLVAAAAADGAQIGAAAARNPEFGPAEVRLEPGGEAHAWLQVAAAGNYPASTCQPATAHGLRVYPPGQTEAGYVRQDFPACAGDGAQLLTIMPVRSGKAITGTTP